MSEPPYLVTLDVDIQIPCSRGESLGRRLTVKASRWPSGENCKSVIGRNEIACSTLNAGAGSVRLCASRLGEDK